MKNLIVIVCVYCLAIGFLFSSSTTPAEVIDKIVAILDEELIFLSEIRECTEKPVVKVLANLQNSPNIEQDALQYMIERRLLQQDIQYLAFPKERDLTMSLALQYIINTYHKGDEQGFKQQLQAQAITDAELEEELTLYMKGIDYIRRKYRFNADIDTPDVVSNLFQQWLKELKAKAKIQTSF